MTVGVGPNRPRMNRQIAARLMIHLSSGLWLMTRLHQRRDAADASRAPIPA